MTRRAPNPMIAALLLALLVVAWIAAAPVQFGGQAMYVIVSGNSMEPTMYRGDLAVLLRAEAYRVGDVVTYRHPTIGPVIHRIIGVDDGRFVLQGDHNSWEDDYRPAHDDIYGRLWFFVPRLGAALDSMRAPLPMALLALAIGAIAMYPALKIGTRQRDAGTSAGPARPHAGLSRSDLLFAVAALGFAAAVLALFAFTRPLTRTTGVDIPYTHSGQFSYRADVPPGIYDGTVAQTGDPIFRRVTSALPATFAYRFSTEQPAQLSGNCALYAELSDGDGWRRSLELQPETPLQGTGCTVTGIIDLAQVQALIDAFEEQTGVSRTQYTLALAPRVTITGSLAGEGLDDTFTPRFAFRVDHDRLVPMSQETMPAQQGMVRGTKVLASTIPLPGGALDVGMARRLALSLLMIAISAGLLLWRGVLRTEQDTAARVRFRFGEHLATARALDLSGARVVDLAEVDDLGKLAERLGRPIIETPHGFVLLDGDVAYRLRSQAGDEAP